LRSLGPFYRIIPYVMRTRVDAQDYFEDRVEVAAAEAWLRSQRVRGLRFGLLHLMVAAIVRTLSQWPRLNRFVAGQRIYARNEILISFALKKRLHEDAPETAVKLCFEPTATVFEVAEAIDAAVVANRSAETHNQADRAARLFMLCPGLVVRVLLWAVRTLDYMGLMPDFIRRASPFHTSVFVTDIGSLGVKPIYHHLYEFGTTSIFVAFGAKEEERVLDEAGRVVLRRSVGLKIVNDERICDGHYYASAFKYMLKLLRHPERLEVPPERVVEDVD